MFSADNALLLMLENRAPRGRTHPLTAAPQSTPLIRLNNQREGENRGDTPPPRRRCCCRPGWAPKWGVSPGEGQSPGIIDDLRPVPTLQRKCQKIADPLRIRVRKYCLLSSFSLVSRNYLKRSESVDHIRKNSATEKCNTKNSSSGSSSKWGREFRIFFFPLSALMTGLCFPLVCLELSQGFDFNLRPPTQIA